MEKGSPHQDSIQVAEKLDSTERKVIIFHLINILGDYEGTSHFKLWQWELGIL